MLKNAEELLYWIHTQSVINDQVLKRYSTEQDYIVDSQIIQVKVERWQHVPIS